MRVLVLGGPRTGKTTLATRLGHERLVRVRHTDDLITTHSWSDASDEVARWLEEPGPWVIEGVAAVRALRKWLEAHRLPSSGLPFDELFVGSTAKVLRTPGQEQMARACESIWDEVRPHVLRRGVQPSRF